MGCRALAGVRSGILRSYLQRWIMDPFEPCIGARKQCETAPGRIIELSVISAFQ
jgi:hypothetical protein